MSYLSDLTWHLINGLKNSLGFFSGNCLLLLIINFQENLQGTRCNLLNDSQMLEWKAAAAFYLYIQKKVILVKRKMVPKKIFVFAKKKICLFMKS